MSALEELAQAILDNRVSLVPIAATMISNGYDSVSHPIYQIEVAQPTVSTASPS